MGIYRHIEGGFLIKVTWKSVPEIIIGSDGTIQHHVIVEIYEMLRKALDAMKMQFNST